MKDESIRSFIKEEAIVQFDGDYDVLFAAAKDKPVDGMTNARGEALTFKDALYSQASSARTSSGELDELLVQLEEQYPTMQISVPELTNASAEDWVTASLNPYVAVLDSDFNESTTDVVTAYDSEGNSYELSATEEPEHLTIVISPSERVMAFPREDAGRTAIDECIQGIDPIAQTVNYNLYLIEELPEECGGTGGGGTGGGGTGGSTGCDRETNNNYDYINKAKFKDYGTMRQVEKWVSGKPEVRLFVAFAQSNVSSNFNYTGLSYAMGENGWFKRKWLNEWTTVKNFDYQVVRWDPDIYGDRMYYTWVEEDPSLFSVSLKLNVISTFNFLDIPIANVTANGTAKFSIGGADDVIAGPVEVEFCDNTDGEGTEYKTPMIFWVNQQ